jgi:hypothetical protein
LALGLGHGPLGSFWLAIGGKLVIESGHGFIASKARDNIIDFLIKTTIFDRELLLQ